MSKKLSAIVLGGFGRLGSAIVEEAYKDPDITVKGIVGRSSVSEREVPDEIEYALIRAALTPEQRRLFEFNMAMAASKVSEAMSDEVIALIGQSGTVNLVSAANIASQLKDRFPELTAQKVMEIQSSLKEVSTK